MEQHNINRESLKAIVLQDTLRDFITLSDPERNWVNSQRIARAMAERTERTMQRRKLSDEENTKYINLLREIYFFEE